MRGRLRKALCAHRVRARQDWQRFTFGHRPGGQRGTPHPPPLEQVLGADRELAAPPPPVWATAKPESTRFPVLPQLGQGAGWLRSASLRWRSKRSPHRSHVYS